MSELPPDSRAPAPVRIVAALAELGATLTAFIVAMALESIYVSVAHGTLLAGGWETVAIRKYVMPVAFAFLVPTAIAMRLLGALVARTPVDPVARRLSSAVSIAFASAVAWGVSEGRHFNAPPVRMAFVLGLGIIAGLLVFSFAPRVARASRGLLVALGVAVALGCWMADAFVLPRLYPAFHAALFLVALGGAALASIAIPTERPWGRGVGLIALGVAGLSLSFARTAAERLESYDNVRLVLIERAPLLGRAVRLATSLRPPRDDASGSNDAASGDLDTRAGGPAALDWRGRDFLFISIDALRADHVGAYGYGRPTTPNIDRLAREGVRFDAAYCPTPHTSYSVTSMMTGKYMRPLLALGVGEDSDTWAGLLRQYGYRTAAFYPPAVFFIDEERFRGFRDRGLDFEYRKVEFASPDLRVKQIEDYVARAPANAPLFLWVHLFEPHEPYVMHAEHPFGDPAAPKPLDAYDSEIAEADAALGAIVDRVRKKRPHVVTIVAADHGEEFGEHGGRYHGTTVYDEQVRVPLVVAAPGEGLTPSVVTTPVQTIDVLPTVLSALRIPRPARVRGRDLGPVLAGVAPKSEQGFAFVETDDSTLVAEGAYRLVCERRVMACALFDPKSDPLETHDLGREHPEIAARLRARGADLARSHGRFERGRSADYPEALRRALQGDAEAALEVAPLLDDVRLDLRRAAARALFELHVPDTAPFAERAFAGDADDEVKRWAALALVRMRAPGANDAHAAVQNLLAHGEGEWRFRAALALAEAGEPRGGDVLAARLAVSLDKSADAGADAALSFADERAVVRALGALREKTGVAPLVKALDDVRLRPLAAEALGAIGDPAARAPLLAAFERERYVSMRSPEARALVALGARAEIEPTLRRFAGVPEPWLDGARIALAAGLVKAPAGASFAPKTEVRIGADARRDPRRLYVVTAPREGGAGAGDAGGASVEVRVGTGVLAPAASDGDVQAFELADGEGAELSAPDGVIAWWTVPHASELPPPPPVPWDAGPEPELAPDGAVRPDVDRAPARQ